MSKKKRVFQDEDIEKDYTVEKAIDDTLLSNKKPTAENVYALLQTRNFCLNLLYVQEYMKRYSNGLERFAKKAYGPICDARREDIIVSNYKEHPNHNSAHITCKKCGRMEVVKMWKWGSASWYISTTDGKKSRISPAHRQVGLAEEYQTMIEEAIKDLEQRSSYVTPGLINDYLRLVKQEDMPMSILHDYLQQRKPL